MKTFSKFVSESRGGETSGELTSRLGPKATEKQDSEELSRQKKHLDQKTTEYANQSERENGGGAAIAKAKSFALAKQNIK